jgi:hypothetical protein
MKNLSRLAGLFLLCISPFTIQAANVGTGFTSGPDDSFSINMTLGNSAGSTSDIINISINGSTATAFPILWDAAGTLTNTTGSTATISGENTQVLNIAFTAGFGAGESISLSGMDPDGVPSPASVTIGQMAGVTVTFTFADRSIWQGVFVDDPAVGAGLKLAAVPEPSTWLMMATGLLLLGGSRWMKHNRG